MTTDPIRQPKTAWPSKPCRTLWLGLSLLLSQLLIAGQVNTPATTHTEEYRVGAGDVLLIIVEGQPELSGSYAVARDGTILLPLIRRVRAMERSVRDLEKEISERLAKDYLVDPKVSVGVREYNSRQVYLMIGNASVVSRPLGPKGMLSVLLLQSGVPAKVFTSRKATVTRTEAATKDKPASSRVVATVDLAALMLKGDVKQDVKLRRGDVVRVPGPESRFVYLLVGDSPAASVPLGERSTLSELLLSVKLPTVVYSSGKATVTRTLPEAPDKPPKARLAATVDLKKLMLEHDLANDCVLEHGDIVRIPSAESRAVYLMVGDLPVMSLELGTDGTLSELLIKAKVPVSLFSTGRATVTRTRAKDGQGAAKPKVVADVDLAALMLKHQADQEVTLTPGDIIRIPKAGEKFVYLLVERGVSGVIGSEARDQRYGRMTRIPLEAREQEATAAAPRLEKIKHPLGEVGTLSQVLLDANVEPQLFETSVAIVSRIEKHKGAKGNPTAVHDITTSAVVDLYDLLLNLDRSQDIDLKPKDIIYILNRRKVRDRGYVYALGAVKKPGAYACSRRLDARDLIALAGGYSPEPADPGFSITRGQASHARTVQVGTYAIRSASRGADDFLMQVGDTVYVPPPNGAALPGDAITVLGSVKRPGVVKHTKDMRLTDALAKAGGCNGVGSLGKIVVKRRASQGTVTAARLLCATLKERYAGAEPTLAPGDYVIVHP